MKPKSVVVLALICLAIFTSHQVFADTDGTELQIFPPSQLEIQLGADWAGTPFTLRTDMGTYPQSVYVDETGVLKIEIGGSSTYILSCLSLGSAHPSSSPDRDRVSVSPGQTEETMREATKVPVPVLVLAGALLFASGCAFTWCGALLIRRKAT